MVIPESRSCSEMKAATELPISERLTLSSDPSAPPVALPDEPELEDPPRSERISQLEARVSRLQFELRALLNERKQEREIGQHRIDRANECLQHARDARIAIKAYVDACDEVTCLGSAEVFETLHADCLKLEVARMKANDAYKALVALVAKPL